MATITKYMVCVPCAKKRGWERIYTDGLEFNDDFYEAGVCDFCDEITLVCTYGIWEDE